MAPERTWSRRVGAFAAAAGGDAVLRALADRWALEGQGRGRAPHLRPRATPPFQILIYHRVHPDAGPFTIDAVPPDRFDRQMKHLARAYHTLPLEELLDRAREGTLPHRAVAVTFDDGYADNFEHAFPILRRRGIPATVFLVSGCIETGAMLWHDRVLRAFAATGRRRWRSPWDGMEAHAETVPDRRRAAFRALGALKPLAEEARLASVAQLEEELGVTPPSGDERLMLDWKGLRAMGDGGISFGSHTETHPILSRTDPARAWLELTRSKQAIEEGAWRPVTLFAYPNGRPEDYTEEIVGLVRRAGYRAAVTTTFGANEAGDDVYRLRRGTPWLPGDAGFRLQLAFHRLCDPGPVPRAGGVRG